MKLFIGAGALLACAAGVAGAEPRWTNRLEVPVFQKPSRDSAIVGRIGIGAKVEAGAAEGSWSSVSHEGLVGFVDSRHLAELRPSNGALCRRGRAALEKRNFNAAASYLRAAFDGGVKDRVCLDALARVYQRRGPKADLELVRARIRSLEKWLPGTYCDVQQRLVLTVTDDGGFTFKAGALTLATGRVDLVRDEILLRTADGHRQGLSLFIKRRGSGHVLVTRSADELQPDFCPGN